MIPRSRQFQNEVNCSFCNLKNINTEYYPNLKLDKKKHQKIMQNIYVFLFQQEIWVSDVLTSEVPCGIPKTLACGPRGPLFDMLPPLLLAWVKSPAPLPAENGGFSF